MRKFSAKWIPKCLIADPKCQRCQSSEQFWNFFGAIQLISCCNWWPWTKPGYITMTRRQNSNQMSGGIEAHPTPKNSDAKIGWKISRLDFLGSRRHSPHWYSSKGPNCQRGVLFTSAGAIEELLKEKYCGKFTKMALFSHDNAPAHRAIATQKKLAYLGFKYLDHPPYSPDLVQSDYHLFPGLKKTIESSPFFARREGHYCRGDLVWRTYFWIFLSGLQKLGQRTKKCVELRGEYVE